MTKSPRHIGKRHPHRESRSRSAGSDERRTKRILRRKRLERGFRWFLTLGLTHQKIADRLGLPRRVVSRYINKRQARKRLRQSSSRIAKRRRLNSFFQLPKRVSPEVIRQSNPALYASVLISLTARQRQTFLYYFERGLKAPEVAGLYKVSRSAVTRQIARIRKAFRRLGLPEPKHCAQGRKTTRLRSLSAWSSDSY